MAKNSLKDLNDHLFSQMERLCDEGLSADQIEQEVKRAEAIVDVADQITEGAKLQLSAARLYAEHGDTVLKMLPKISGPSA